MSGLLCYLGPGAATPEVPVAHAAYLPTYCPRLEWSEAAGLPGRNADVKASCSLQDAITSLQFKSFLWI